MKSYRSDYCYFISYFFRFSHLCLFVLFMYFIYVFFWSCCTIPFSKIFLCKCCIFIFIHTYAYRTCIQIYYTFSMYVCMNVWVFIHTHTHIYIRIHICLCVCLYVSVCVYVSYPSHLFITGFRKFLFIIVISFLLTS